VSNSIADKLPSRFQLGDVVRVGATNGPVTGICFREAKVFYEVGGIMYHSDDVTEPLKVVPHPTKWKSDMCDAFNCQLAGRCMNRGSCEVDE
jgi:hypothetical protein